MTQNRNTGRGLPSQSMSEMAAGVRPTADSVALDVYATDILAAVLAGIETLPEVDAGLEGGATRWLAKLRDLGVPYQPDDWFDGPLSCARRKAYSRAAMRLEGAGLILRITQPNRDRVTHLQLTAAGLRRALRMVGSSANRAAVAEGLRRTTWGRELAVNLTVNRRPQAGNP